MSSLLDSILCHLYHKVWWHLIAPPPSFTILDGKWRLYYWCKACNWVRMVRWEWWGL